MSYRYSSETIDQITKLRSQGNTYGEIRNLLKISIPKSSLSYICRHVDLPKEYQLRIKEMNNIALDKGRRIALAINRIKREKFFEHLNFINKPVAYKILDQNIGKIALAMLCLGEASKYNVKKRRSFNLGNSDPRIIILFLGLLRLCYPFNITKVRATVQCRADQNVTELKRYWQMITGIPDRLFYKSLVDPRTIGKPTKQKNYHGVLRIDYFDTKIQLDLESLADLTYNQILKLGR
jgi:hypothetical protein